MSVLSVHIYIFNCDFQFDIVVAMAWIIVGLGNPGEAYENTRHNVGRMALAHFAKLNDLPALKEDKKSKVSASKCVLEKTILALVAPDTYMNKSGSAVAKYVKSPKAAERLIVIYDDLDLPLGTMKLSFDRGSGGHKGLESVIRAVKTKKFARVRIGISQTTAAGKLKKPSGEKEVLDFILAKFSASSKGGSSSGGKGGSASGGQPSEIDVLKHVFKRVSSALKTIVAEGPMLAMNEFNSDAH